MKRRILLHYQRLYKCAQFHANKLMPISVFLGPYTGQSNRSRIETEKIGVSLFACLYSTTNHLGKNIYYWTPRYLKTALQRFKDVIGGCVILTVNTQDNVSRRIFKTKPYAYYSPSTDITNINAHLHYFTGMSV